VPVLANSLNRTVFVLTWIRLWRRILKTEEKPEGLLGLGKPINQPAKA
jgi:hypothetical protein